MKSIGAFSLALLLGCATTSRIKPEFLQQACDQTTRTFVESADCMNDLIKDPEFADSVRTDVTLQLYTAHASALASRVRAGRLGEADARLQQTALLNQIVRERRVRADAAGDALLRYYVNSERSRAAAAPSILTCQRTGQSVICF